jgi:hypothetical protein
MAFIGNASQYNQITKGNTIGDYSAMEAKAQQSRELLSEQMAPPNNIGIKEGEMGGSATAGLLKVAKGVKDVSKTYKDAGKAIKDAKKTVANFGRGGDALSQMMNDPRFANNKIIQLYKNSIAGGGKAPIGGGATTTPQGIDKPSVLPSNPKGALPANAKQGLLDTAQSHNDALSQMSDGDKATIMAKMEADPIAGQNFKAPGMSYTDRVGVLNARSGIIGDAIDDVNRRVAAAPANVLRGLVGNAVSPNAQGVGLRIGQTLNGQGGVAINNNMALLNGDLRTAANQVGGQARGALANSANNIHGALQGLSTTAGQVGDDIASGVSKAQGVIDAGISTAGTVLDALGPIGDLLGVGMGIFGGIEDAIGHHKAEEQAKNAEATMKQPVANATPAAQTTSITLDTSKISQASASAHF